MSKKNHDDAATERVPRSHQPTTPLPPEPEDVDALLAESLKAQSEADFTWKEPERKPRWWERAEAQAPEPGAVSPAFTGEVAAVSAAGDRQGIRLGSMVFALVALVLAGWVVASVAFGLSMDPLMVGLVICSLAGIALIAAGLRPKPGTRI
ncbi:hypothetical protein [Nesterenkonia ebinurensis]|uniref:hypothetical protein n=1 Tax=Nesterenkonia ebinurensis TaxID=2608252 RepID=UPI00123E124D|nr:hypothetical protein [Nesterenkonia ebinurensis]